MCYCLLISIKYSLHTCWLCPNIRIMLQNRWAFLLNTSHIVLCLHSTVHASFQTSGLSSSCMLLCIIAVCQQKQLISRFFFSLFCSFSILDASSCVYSYLFYIVVNGAKTKTHSLHCMLACLKFMWT